MTNADAGTAGQSSLTRWHIVVPARLSSQRLPHKPLADLGGVPLIVRVAQNLAPLTARGASLVVATDAVSIMQACAKYGVQAVMTKPDHESGTDRCAEAAAVQAASGPANRSYILNVQGDEPFVATTDLAALMASMESQQNLDMGTLAHLSDNVHMALDPNVVKVVRSSAGLALYFSRSLVPYDRDAGGRQHVPIHYWQHLGVYAFPRARLAEFVRLGPSPLERLEKLEQLRAVEAGWRIWLEPARSFARGIDTPADLEAARARY